MSLECLCDLTRHQKAVNIVRWSPDGKLLASGDDESVIIVWQLKPGDSGCGGGLFDDDHENKENWVVYKMIRSHLDDVYDLSWSGCGQFLLSGSVDNAAIITNVHKNNKVRGFWKCYNYSIQQPLFTHFVAGCPFFGQSRLRPRGELEQKAQPCRHSEQ